MRVPDAASQQTGERAVEHAATKTKPAGVTGTQQNPIPPEQPANLQVPLDGLVAAGGSGDIILPPPQKTPKPEDRVEGKDESTEY